MRIFIAMLILLLPATVIAEDYGRRNNGSSSNLFVEQQRKIFFNDTYFFGQNGFFDVGDNVRLSTLEQAYHELRKENEELREELRLIREALGQIQASLNGGGQPDVDINDFAPPVENQDAVVQKIFVTQCADCHTEGSASKITLLTRDGRLKDFDERQIREIYARTVLTPEELKQVGKTAMPKGGPRLPISERGAIRDWANKKLGF